MNCKLQLGRSPDGILDERFRLRMSPSGVPEGAPGPCPPARGLGPGRLVLLLPVQAEAALVGVLEAGVAAEVLLGVTLCHELVGGSQGDAWVDE